MSNSTGLSSFLVNDTQATSPYSYNTTHSSTVSPDVLVTDPSSTLSDLDYPLYDALNNSTAVTSNETLTEVLSTTIATTLAARDSGDFISTQAMIGIFIAIVSHFIVGVSTVIKKQSLKQLKENGYKRASEGGFGYLKVGRWWTGLSLNCVGEFLNFLAYTFAPAILVTPLAVISILTTAILSPYVLQERLGLLGKLGCILVVLGCLIVTLCGPKDQEISTMSQLETALLSPQFLIYFSIVFLLTGFLLYISPKYGHKYIMIYVLLISTCASLAVFLCKGVGLGFMLLITTDNDPLTHWSFYVCFVLLVMFLSVEIVVGQRALDLYNVSILASLIYLAFVSLVVLTSTFLFAQNNVGIGWKNILLTIAGFSVNIVALIILNIDKDPTLKITKDDHVDGEATTIPPLEGTEAAAKMNVEQLYEIRSDSKSDNYTTPPCHSPKSTPLKMSSLPSCTIPNITTTMFRESTESNSCLSLISEAPSSKNNLSYDSSDINSQRSSPGSNFRPMNGENGHSSVSHRSSFSNGSVGGAGSGKVLQETPLNQRQSEGDVSVSNSFTVQDTSHNSSTDSPQRKFMQDTQKKMSKETI